VLAGGGGPEDAGQLLIVDAAIGEVVHHLEPDAPVRWIGLDGEGLLACVTDSQVVTYGLRGGEIEWSWVTPSTEQRVRGYLGSGLLLLPTSRFGGSVTVIRSSTGQVLDQVCGLFRVGRPRLSVQNIEDRWYLLTPSQATVLGADGSVLWRDGVYPYSIQERLFLVVGDHQAVMLGLNGFQQGRGWFYTLYLLDRESGVVRDERALGPIPQPIRAGEAVFLRDRLVLSAGSNTIILPGSGAGP